jgi:hypothetical protein
MLAGQSAQEGRDEVEQLDREALMAILRQLISPRLTAEDLGHYWAYRPLLQLWRRTANGATVTAQDVTDAIGLYEYNGRESAAIALANWQAAGCPRGWRKPAPTEDELKREYE